MLENEKDHVLIVRQAARGVSECYESIINLFAELESFVPRFLVHARQRISPEVRDIATQILVSFMSLCDLSAKLVHDGRIKKYFKTLVLGKDEKVQEELIKLRRLAEDEARMAGALTLSAVTASSKAIDGVAVTVTDVQTSLEDFKSEFKQQMSKIDG